MEWALRNDALDTRSAPVIATRPAPMSTVCPHFHATADRPSRGEAIAMRGASRPWPAPPADEENASVARLVYRWEDIHRNPLAFLLQFRCTRARSEDRSVWTTSLRRHG